MSFGSLKKHLEKFSNSFFRLVLIFRLTLDLQFLSKGCKISERHQRRLFRSNRVNQCHSAIDEVIYIWLIRVCPSGSYSSVPSAIHIPAFYSSTSHCKVTFFVLLINLSSEVFLQQPFQPFLSSLISLPFFSSIPSFISQTSTLNSAKLCVRLFYLKVRTG